MTGCHVQCVILSLAMVAISGAPVFGQGTTDELVRQLRSGHVDLRTVELAGTSKDPSVQKALENFFDETTDRDLKQQIAVHLVRKESGNTRYFEYLAAAAREAVSDLAPNVEKIDSSGSPVPKTRSDQFLQWCTNRSINPDYQESLELIVYPQNVMALGATMDVRAAVILRQGLSSKNLSVSYNSAYGLALIGKAAEVRYIVEFAEQQPAKLQFLFGAMLSRIKKDDARAEIERVLRPGSVLEQSYKNSVSANASSAAKR